MPPDGPQGWGKGCGSYISNLAARSKAFRTSGGKATPRKGSSKPNDVAVVLD